MDMTHDGGSTWPGVVLLLVLYRVARGKGA
jgi:hypothetical protein